MGKPYILAPFDRNTDLESSIVAQVSAEIRERLSVFCYREVSSVLDVAKVLGGGSPETVALILSRTQSAGRGQEGRPWINSVNAFLGCLLLPQCEIAREHLSCVSLVIAIEIAALLASYDAEVGVKWPNDVLSKRTRKKICGVLLETDGGSQRGAHAQCLRIGIGVNLESCPEGATSLYAESGRRVPIDQFSARLLERCVPALERFKNEGFEVFRLRWQTLDLLRGEEVDFEHGKRKWRGFLSGVDAAGRICLSVDGKEQSFATGRIVNFPYG